MNYDNVLAKLLRENDDVVITSNDEQTVFTFPQEVQEQIKNLKEGESTTFTFEIPLNDDLTT